MHVQVACAEKLDLTVQTCGLSVFIQYFIPVHVQSLSFSKQLFTVTASPLLLKLCSGAFFEEHLGEETARRFPSGSYNFLLVCVGDVHIGILITFKVKRIRGQLSRVAHRDSLRRNVCRHAERWLLPCMGVVHSVLLPVKKLVF